MINRCAVVVRAKQPFLDWLKALPDMVQPDMSLQDVNHEPHVYLLPEYELESQTNKLLEQFHDLVFEAELRAWWINPSDWPRDRDFDRFLQWFDIQFHSVVEDLVDAPLLNEE